MSVKNRRATDPGCGMKVDKQNPRSYLEYESRTYYFCSPSCESSFEKDPQKYLDSNYQPTMGHL